MLKLHYMLPMQQTFRRGIGTQLQIRGSTPPAIETPIEDGFNLNELASKEGHSVVTIAAAISILKTRRTYYGTGFVLVSQKNYALVLTSFPPDKDRVKEYFVYFEGSNVGNKADVLKSDKKFVILIIRTDKEYAPVTFSDHPLDRELVFTVAATGGIKLSPNGRIMDESLGSVVTYRGKVAVSAYDALDLEFEHVHKAGTFFEVTCSTHDDIITLRNIDKKAVRTTNTILSAPVFCFDGKVGGIIFSPGNWGDVKVGLHAKEVISHIQSMCGKNWQEHLKKSADDWMLKNTNHHP